MGKVDTNANLNFESKFEFLLDKKAKEGNEDCAGNQGYPLYIPRSKRIKQNRWCGISGHENHMLRRVNTFCIHYLEKKKNIQNSWRCWEWSESNQTVLEYNLYPNISGWAPKRSEVLQRCGKLPKLRQTRESSQWLAVKTNIHFNAFLWCVCRSLPRRVKQHQILRCLTAWESIMTVLLSPFLSLA